MIPWKLTARNDDLLVKEFGIRSTEPLIIDMSMLPGRNPKERISKTTWLVKHWADKRTVGLVLNGHIISPKVGSRHAIHLLTELAFYGKG
jgi:uncharacterized protein (DUF58 family)